MDKIFKCEKVFVGIFIFSSLSKIKMKVFSHRNTFFCTHDTHFNNIYSFIQFYSKCLRAGPESYLITLLKGD